MPLDLQLLRQDFQAPTDAEGESFLHAARVGDLQQLEALLGKPLDPNDARLLGTGEYTPIAAHPVRSRQKSHVGTRNNSDI